MASDLARPYDDLVHGLVDVVRPREEHGGVLALDGLALPHSRNLVVANSHRIHLPRNPKADAILYILDYYSWSEVECCQYE